MGDHKALPLIRSHERIDYKRCPKKWFWKWRMGLVPKAQQFGALEFGTWMHAALQAWYVPGIERNGSLAEHFVEIAKHAISLARFPRVGKPVPEYMIEKAEELAILGEAMAAAYEEHYHGESINVLHTEIPLEFTIGDSDTGKLVAVHMLKPDMVYEDGNGDIWLMENKTATQVRLEHLVIDDQARPYVTMAEAALRKAKALGSGQVVKGIMYNFLRKALPDERERDSAGRALNKNGSVSKRQPTPSFVRYPLVLSRKAKAQALYRIQGETVLITSVAQALRDKRIDPKQLPKTPHNSCPKTCSYFTMCVSEENGSDIRTMQKTLFTRQNPYDYAETTDVPLGFEMG